jgi:nucleoside-diphosphate-sugar epimerase
MVKKMAERLSTGLSERIQQRILERRKVPAPDFPLPDEALTNLYATGASVSIDKARRMLGYNPVFTFEKGMEITAQYLRWANLVPEPPLTGNQDSALR